MEINARGAIEMSVEIYRLIKEKIRIAEYMENFEI